jgi:hypothetical protein
MQTVRSDHAEVVFGAVTKLSHRFRRISLDLPSDADPYSHFMKGNMYFGELCGGTTSAASFQSIAVDNIPPHIDYVRPTWSTALHLEPDHDCFRVIYSLQATSGQWEWHAVEADAYRQACKLLWYIPASNTFHDVSNLSEAAFETSVLVIHLDRMDITYYAHAISVNHNLVTMT